MGQRRGCPARGPLQMRADKAMWTNRDKPGSLLARNIAVDYLAIAIDLALGILMLPFNVAHLGKDAYGLFVLTTSVTTYFSMLDLGYGSAQVKFAAQYRALRNVSALNEIASTLFFLFAAMSLACYLLATVLAVNLGHILALAPDDVPTATTVLLIVSVYAAVALPFGVFGGITSGFQRYYFNNVISIATSLTVAAATFVVLSLGYGIVELVTVTTAIRILSLLGYRLSAYRAFPLLSIRWQHVRRARLREVTGFSAFLLIIDVATKINVAADTLVIGAFMGTAAVAVWAVGARLIAAVRSLSTVLSRFLFPIIVDSAALGNHVRLRAVLVQGTRLSLAAVIPLALTLALLADAVVAAWVGPAFEQSQVVVQILAAVVIIRIGTATSYAVLKGAEHHRFAAACSGTVAVTNLALSVLFVRWYGLAGVAVATLIPVSLASMGVVFPAACRCARLPLGRAFRTAVWPAVWPALPAAVVVSGGRMALPDGAVMIVLASLGGGVVYVVCFLAFALATDERQWYVRKVTEVMRAPTSVSAA